MTFGRHTISMSAAVLLLIGVNNLLIARESRSQSSANDSEVRLDHVYLVVDAPTYDAIAKSDFLRDEVAAVTQRTTTSNGGQTWSGAYVQGRNTYIELFAPGGPFGGVDEAGIGFNVAVTGAAEELRRRLAQVGEAASVVFRTGLRDGRQEPWFYSLRSDTSSSSAIARWVMEYHPDFLKWEGTATPLPDGRVARRQVPRRAYNANRPLLNVTGVTAAMSDDDRERLRKELTTYGWAMRTDDTTAPGGFVAGGPDVTLTALPAVNGRRGIRTLTLQLSRSWVGPAEVRFGPTSILRLGASTTAVWTFW